MSFALDSLLGSGSQDHDLNLTFPVITALTLTVGAVAWRCCFGSKQTVVHAKNALRATSVDETNLKAVKVKKKVEFADSAESDSSGKASSSQPALNEKNCSVSGVKGLRFSEITIHGLDALSERERVYPKDLVPVLSRFIDLKEDKEQHIAQIMLRRAAGPLCKSSRGAVPEWFYTRSSSSEQGSVLPYIEGSDIQGFVRDFLSEKSYAGHPDYRL